MPSKPRPARRRPRVRPAVRVPLPRQRGGRHEDVTKQLPRRRKHRRKIEPDDDEK